MKTRQTGSVPTQMTGGTDMDDPFHAANIAYDAGQNDGYMNGYADAIEIAVQRVIELPDLIDAGFSYVNLLNRAAVIDAIRGES